MNIHEYQAKEVLRAFGVPVPKGKPAFTVEEAVAAAQELGGPVWVVKAQIHAGGRGMGGGVMVVMSFVYVKMDALRMVGMTLVTHQTGPAGRLVKRLYIEDGSAIDRELYLSALVDRATSRIAFIVSTEGGMDIEEVAHKTPEKIHTFQIEPVAGYSPYIGNEIAVALGVKGEAGKQIGKVVKGLYDAFIAKDMSLSGNQSAGGDQGRQHHLPGCQAEFRRQLLYRHKDIQALRDLDEEDPAEVEASKYDLSYIKLDGEIGCMVNGAGSPWRPWTSSSSMAASRPTSWMWAAAPPRKKSPRPSRSSSAIPM